MKHHERQLTLIPRTWVRLQDVDSTLAYAVGGLPSNLAVEIAELNGRWQILVTRDGLSGDWQGDFDTAEEALAALQAEVGLLPRD